MFKKIFLFSAFFLGSINILHAMEEVLNPAKIQKAVADKDIPELIKLTNFDYYVSYNTEGENILNENLYLSALRKIGLGNEDAIKNNIYHPIMAYRGINYIIINPRKDIHASYLGHLTFEFLENWSLARKIRLLDFIAKLPAKELDKKEKETGNTLLHEILIWKEEQTVRKTGHATLDQIKPVIAKLLECGANPYLRNDQNYSGVQALQLFGEQADTWLEQYCKGKEYYQDPDKSILEPTLNTSNDSLEGRHNSTEDLTTASVATSTIYTNPILSIRPNNTVPAPQIGPKQKPHSFKLISGITCLALALCSYFGYKYFKTNCKSVKLR